MADLSKLQEFMGLLDSKNYKGVKKFLEENKGQFNINEPFQVKGHDSLEVPYLLERTLIDFYAGRRDWQTVGLLAHAGAKPTREVSDGRRPLEYMMDYQERVYIETENRLDNDLQTAIYDLLDTGAPLSSEALSYIMKYCDKKYIDSALKRIEKQDRLAYGEYLKDEKNFLADAAYAGNEENLYYLCKMYGKKTPKIINRHRVIHKLLDGQMNHMTKTDAELADIMANLIDMGGNVLLKDVGKLTLDDLVEQLEEINGNDYSICKGVVAAMSHQQRR